MLSLKSVSEGLVHVQVIVSLATKLELPEHTKLNTFPGDVVSIAQACSSVLVGVLAQLAVSVQVLVFFPAVQALHSTRQFKTKQMLIIVTLL